MMFANTPKKIWISALVAGIVGEAFPIFGIFGAALVFPEGVHSSHAFLYMGLALLINFVVVFYGVLGLASMLSSGVKARESD